MKTHLKVYINKLFTYLPVAIFVLTLLLMMNLSQTITDLKNEFGIDAIDEFMKLYVYYFTRTVILALLLPLYDLVFSAQKISSKNAILIHCLLVTSTVGILIYQTGIPILSLILSIGMSLLIYIIIWVIIYLREKQFLNDANEIFKENKE